jgi:hypothetical protein
MYDSDALYALLAGSIALVIIIGFIALALSITTYILGSIGYYRIAQRNNLPNPWLVWIPVASSYMLGAIADAINAKSGKQTKWGIFLICGAGAMFVVNLLGIILGIFLPAAVVLIFTIINWCIGIAVAVISYIALHTIYKDYSTSATGLLVLSIFVGIATPFIIFSFGKKEPLSGGGRGYANNNYNNYGGQQSYNNYNNQQQFIAQDGNISGVAGMYTGQNFKIRNGEELIFGRDGAFAHIIIDSNAAKVSRKHCAIRYDANSRVYSVTDFSSNGTFQNGGTRLVANMPSSISAGTVISLGDSGNQFRLG